MDEIPSKVQAFIDALPPELEPQAYLKSGHVRIHGNGRGLSFESILSNPDAARVYVEAPAPKRLVRPNLAPFFAEFSVDEDWELIENDDFVVVIAPNGLSVDVTVHYVHEDPRAAAKEAKDMLGYSESVSHLEVQEAVIRDSVLTAFKSRFEDGYKFSQSPDGLELLVKGPDGVDVPVRFDTIYENPVWAEHLARLRAAVLVQHQPAPEPAPEPTPEPATPKARP